MPEFDSSVEYRSVSSFDGYAVSNKGEVWSRRTPGRLAKKWHILKALPKKCGHVTVDLCRNGKPHTTFIHYLVLTEFVGARPFEGAVCRHLDGNPKNNEVSNLRWGTVQENTQDKYLHGTILKGEAHAMAKLSDEEVLEVRRLSAEGKTRRELASMFNISQGQIKNIKLGKCWRHLPNFSENLP